jgi:dTDP-4-amino-4,6-dideoxygalactose transaminase
VHHLYVLMADDRAALAQHLAESGVQTLIHYPVPVHRQTPCSTLRRDPLGLPHAEAHAASCLSIPCHPQMSDVDIARVIDAVNGWR